MVLEDRQPESASVPAWPWRVGLLVESSALAREIADALGEMNALLAFLALPSPELFETVRLIEREKPDILFVELSHVPGSTQYWMDNVRGEGEPLVVAVHTSPDPEQMIAALRAGACEFIHPPVRTSIFDAMERIAAVLENRRNKVVQKGAASGLVSAKGGCGATTVACNLAAAVGAAGERVLLADLDHQAPAAHRILHASRARCVADALDSARRLSSANWSGFVTPVNEQVDLLAGTDTAGEAAPDAWKVDSLFRFVTRRYNRVVADLGRNLNPLNFACLQFLDELIIVTAPDVLALYQTRQMLQALSARGFDRSRVRLILNRNHMAPEDFWVESIEQMFEMSVLEVIPNDYATLNGERKDRYEFPAATSFGRAMARLAGKLVSVAPSAGRAQ